MEKDKLCLSEVKKLGFNDKLIKELLPEPELKTNPKYKKAYPMKLWKMADIEKAMETETFAEEQKKIQQRRKQSEKAVQTKFDKTISDIQRQLEKIVVKREDMDKVRKATISMKQQWYNSQDGIIPKTTYGADEATIERWMVNYIRHRLTTYDAELESLFRKIGKDHAQYILHDGILKKIAEVYPELKEECERQMYLTEDPEE